MVESLYTIKNREIVIDLNIYVAFLVLETAGMAFVRIKLARLLDRVDHLVLYIYNIGAYLALVSILKVLYRVIILPISITFLFLALF